mgnify:FL=1
MAVMNVNPTRMQLTKLRKQLATATRGHKMLKDKRDELMRRFLDLVRENKELREKIERELAECNNHFVNASAVMSKEALDASGEDYRMMILPDHPTPICVRTHTSDPIPYLLYDSRKAFEDGAGVYNEKAAQASGIEVMHGYELIDKLFEEK